MSIDKSQLRDDAANVDVANDGPGGKPAIEIFIGPGLSVHWKLDDKQVGSPEAVLYALNALRDRMEIYKTIHIQGQIAPQPGQVRTYAQVPSSGNRNGRRRL